MKKRTAYRLGLLLLLVLLVTLKSIMWRSPGDEASASGGSETRRNGVVGESQESDSEKTLTTKRERPDANAAKEHRDLEKELDQIIPPEFTADSAALCDVSIKPGETLILGGFKNARSDYEFTTLQAEAVEGEAGQSYVIKSKTLSLSPEISAELGLGSLLSPASLKIQKSVVLPPSETTWMGSSVSITSMPSLTTMANRAATLTVSMYNQIHVIGLMASPGNDGQSIRLRIRDQSLTDDK